MQAPFDPELVTAGVYLVIGPLYGLLWHRHARHVYAALAIAALILAVCAFLRSETVRTWDPHPIRHRQLVTSPAPKDDSAPSTPLAVATALRKSYRPCEKSY
jgi:hypothetical protein